MKSLLFIIAINYRLIFSAILSFIGLNYLGSGESSLYITSYIIIDVLVLFLFSRDITTRKVKMTKGLSLLIFLQLFLLIMYFIEAPKNGYARSLPMLMFAMTMPICYVAYGVAKSDGWKYMTKWLDVLAIITTLSVALNIPRIIASKGYGDMLGMQESFNIGYQSASYYSAFAYSITLSLIVFGEFVWGRFSIFKSKIYNTLSVLLLAIQIALCLMSGGRGGAVLLFVSTYIILKVSDGKKIKKLFVQLSIVAVMGFIPLLLIFPSIGTEIADVISKSTERTFSYISSDGIDMTQTSNRDLEYEAAISCIKESPIIGHGLYRYIDVKSYRIYPHNFFLEILLQGGVLYLIIVLLLMRYLYKRYKKLIIHDRRNVLLIPFICYPATMLQFSGTYMTTALFWFVVVYLLSYKFNAVKSYD